MRGGVMLASAIPRSHPLAAKLEEQSRAERQVVLALDLAWVNDGCAAVILERDGDMLTIPWHSFRIPRPGQRFDPVTICAEFADVAVQWGIHHVTGDAFYPEIVRRETDPRGLSFHLASSGRDRTEAAFLVRDLVRRRDVKMPREVADHFKFIKLHLAPGGSVSIVADRTATTGHSDLAFAVMHGAQLLTKLWGPFGQRSAKLGTMRGAWTSP